MQHVAGPCGLWWRRNVVLSWGKRFSVVGSGPSRPGVKPSGVEALMNRDRVLRYLTLALVIGWTAYPARAQEPGAAAVLTLPTKYVADRFFAVPVTPGGLEVSLLVSTGEETLLYSDTAAQLATPITSGPVGSATVLPAFDAELSIPSPHGEGGLIPIVPGRYRRAYLDASCFGILGETWFAGAIWTLDYPGKKLQLRPVGNLPKVDVSHRVTLGFRTSGMRSRDNNLPRITVNIAGKRFYMLLDSGASCAFTDAARAAMGEKAPAVGATSFISSELLKSWQKKHGWRVVASAEKGADASMIEVPIVEVAGYKVGPVWFVSRPESYLRNNLSRKLDRRVQGVLGGNVLKYFRVTLDIPGSEARFEKP